MSWTVSLANALGASESGVRLIFGQLSGYPLFLLHRMYLRNASASVQHLFFAVTGLFMAWWAIGMDAVFHSTLSILVTFAVLKLFRSSQLAAMLLFTFHIIYLFVGKCFGWKGLTVVMIMTLFIQDTCTTRPETMTSPGPCPSASSA